MKTSLKNSLIALVFFGISHFAGAQTQKNIADTIAIEKTSSVVEERYDSDKKLLEKKEYTIENTSRLSGDRVLFEQETKYSFAEKYLGKPADSKEPKNILSRKQVDKILEYKITNTYTYDSLGRVAEVETVESPWEAIPKKSRTYFTYEKEGRKPVKVWEDLNNSGKFDAGDEMKTYVPEFDKWVSQEK